MAKFNLDEYKNHIKDARKNWFDTPYELAYKAFIKLGYDKKGTQFFFDNASMIVENMREECWKTFKPDEREFTSEMLRHLIDFDFVRELKPADAITWFAEEFPEEIYELSLSNTQSRRSRAGKEFEAIIELLLMGAGIPLDSQGNIGKTYFVNKGLGKLVDLVSPGVVEYSIDKNDVILLSAKTTLRERWQEVPEEMGRTGIKEMYLITLDDTLSEEVLDTLYEANVRLTTTKNNKVKNYNSSRRVLDFEQILEICKSNHDSWKNYKYSEKEKEVITENIKKQIIKHSKHEFVKKYYEKRLLELE